MVENATYFGARWVGGYSKDWCFGIALCHDSLECYLFLGFGKLSLQIGRLYKWE